MDAASLYTTWPDLASAEAAGEALVAQGLAACVNVLPGGQNHRGQSPARARRDLGGAPLRNALRAAPAH